jgi:hypothetical protein
MILRLVRHIFLRSLPAERVRDTRALPGMGLHAADQIVAGIALTKLAGLAPTPGGSGFFSFASCLRPYPWYSLPHA